jgi:hypothetical protein
MEARREQREALPVIDPSQLTLSLGRRRADNALVPGAGESVKAGSNPAPGCFCSQCGADLPGTLGVSHCDEHPGVASVPALEVL